MPRFRKGTTDHDGDGRMGGSMKESDMPTKKKARKQTKKPKAASPVKRRDAAEAKVFQRGRNANRSGIRRDDSPYTGDDRDVWLEGWDFQEGS